MDIFDQIKKLVEDYVDETGEGVDITLSALPDKETGQAKVDMSYQTHNLELF